MTPIAVLLLVGLGMWAALDGTAMGQVMVSRPLITGTLTGVILGDPVEGAAIGGCLELLFIGNVPVGGTHLPEPGPAAIPAVTLALGVPVAGVGVSAGLPAGWAGPGGGLAAGLALGILLAWLGGRTVTLQRSLNERISARAWARGGAHPQLTRAHLLALATDGLRGAVLTGAGLVAAGLLAALPELRPGLLPAWPLSRLETLAIATVVGMLGLGRLLATTAPGVRVFASPRAPSAGDPSVEAGPASRWGPRRLRRPLVVLLLTGGVCGVILAFLTGSGVDRAGAAPDDGGAAEPNPTVHVMGGLP